MKKIIILIFILIITINVSFSKEEKDYTINFNGNKYHLLYSIKNKDFGGYLNEYYRKGETYNIWTDMVAVHHFPNAYSPIDRIKDFKDYLSAMHVPSSLTFDDKKNTAMIDFILIADKQMPIVLEFNIFKYEKSDKCGSVAIQYAKRYSATTTMQIEAIKKDFELNRKRLIKEVKNYKIPKVITTDIDKCISGSDIREKITVNKTPEKTNNTKTITDNSVKEFSELPETTLKEEINKSEEPKDITATAEKNVIVDTSNEVIAKEEIINENNSNEKQIIDIDNNKEIEDIKTSETKDDTTVKKEVLTENEEVSTVNENQDQVTETKNTTNEDIEQAPIPIIQEKTIIKEENIKPATVRQTEHNVKNKKNKKIKEVSYEIKNSKDAYIATPRTIKELKEDVKRSKERQIERKKQTKELAKINARNAKLQAKQQKADTKLNAKNAKKMAKQNAKNEKIQAKQNKADAKKKAKEDKLNAKLEKKKQKQYLKDKRKEEKTLAKAEKHQAKENKKALKKQDKFDKREEKFKKKEIKQQAKEDKKQLKQNKKIEKKEAKKTNLKEKSNKKLNKKRKNKS